MSVFVPSSAVRMSDGLSVEAHVGRPALHAGQFRDEVDEDAALVS